MKQQSLFLRSSANDGLKEIYHRVGQTLSISMLMEFVRM